MAEEKKVKGGTGELGPGWDGGTRTGPAWGKVSENGKEVSEDGEGGDG